MTEDENTAAIKKETHEGFAGKSQTMDQFDSALDQVGTGPRRKTPEEMGQRPSDFLDESQSDVLQHQHKLDDTWAAAEGAGDRDWGTISSS